MRRVVGVLAAAGVLILGGCVPESGVPSLPPTPTATALFATEEEALAAAEDAYAAYQREWARIAAGGGVDAASIEDVTTGDFLASELEGFALLRENGWRARGTAVLVEMRLQFADLTAVRGEEAVGAYVCIDVSGVEVVNGAGESVVSAERPPRQEFEVFFAVSEDHDLLPRSQEVWAGAPVCPVSY